MKGRSKINVRIDGSMVYLRPVKLDDASTIRKWHNDPELMRLARVGEKKITLKQERTDIRAALKSDKQAYHMILRQSDNAPIGFLRFSYIDRLSGNVWLRVIIGERKAWGKGYARDALQSYLNWLFDVIAIHRVTLECYSTNKRAIRFYRQLGFRIEGVLREAVLTDGRYHDIFSFGLLRKDMRSRDGG
jgi:RimJ/RimL family protein N-acetyltransferase